MTAAAAIAAAEAKLRDAGIQHPRWDAQLLLGRAAGWTRTQLLARQEVELPEPVAAAFADLVNRREQRVPLPYLLGTWEFMGHSFVVGSGALIPRPETETLVEAALNLIPPEGRVLEIGVGSGCVTCAIACSREDVSVVGLESSWEALAIADANVRRLVPDGRVTLVRRRFPEEVDREGRFDVIVSNPPYIPSAEIEDLAPEIRRYEPREALDGGADGLDLIRAIAREAPSRLLPGGWLAVEVAAGQSESVMDLLRDGPWDCSEVVPDLSRIPRVVLARRALAG